MQIPLTPCTRYIVFINTSTREERVFLLKPKSVLDELPAESSNVIQRYSKRPKQLQKFCLADYVSKVDVIYLKGDKLPEKFEEKNDDVNDARSSSDDNGISLEDEKDADDNHTSDLLYKAKNGRRYKKRKVSRIIRYLRYNKKNDPENYYRERLMLFTPWPNEWKKGLIFYYYVLTHSRLIVTHWKHQLNPKAMSMSTTLKNLKLQDKWWKMRKM